MSDFNEQIIEEFRTNGGNVTTMRFGKNLILLHTLGAKSGTPRTSPLMALPDDDGWLIIGSAAGSPKDPAWVHNLRANPDITVETPTPTGVTEIPSHATELDDDARAQAWERFVAASEGFQKYTETAEGRVFPIFRIAPAAI